MVEKIEAETQQAVLVRDTSSVLISPRWMRPIGDKNRLRLKFIPPPISWIQSSTGIAADRQYVSLAAT
jgi:hypothetical protein